MSVKLMSSRDLPAPPLLRLTGRFGRARWRPSWASWASNPAPTLTPADAAAWLTAVLEAPAAAVYKNQPGQRVVRVQHDGRDWVVKSRRVGPLERVRQGFVPGPIRREWANAVTLAEVGVAVNPAVAWVEAPRSHALVLPHIEGVSLCHLLMGFELPPPWRNLSRRERRRLAWMVGRQIGAITAAGFVNRDHKPANLILTADCRDATHAAGRPTVTPVLIDPVGVRRRRTRGQAIRMLTVLCRTTLRAGPASREEMLTCLAAAVRRDATLLGTGTKRKAIRELARLLGKAAGRAADRDGTSEASTS